MLGGDEFFPTRIFSSETQTPAVFAKQQQGPQLFHSTENSRQCFCSLYNSPNLFKMAAALKKIAAHDW
jgi:hypothetical protein